MTVFERLKRKPRVGDILQMRLAKGDKAYPFLVLKDPEDNEEGIYAIEAFNLTENRFDWFRIDLLFWYDLVSELDSHG